MSYIFQALSANPTTWTLRRRYTVDTAALLLAGADPASIDSETPESVLVSEAIYSPKYYRESLNWRARLVHAALAGELAVSIDEQPGIVGAWGDNGRWAPMPVDEASSRVRRYELRPPHVFFDIGRDALAAWVKTQGSILPKWLESTNKPDPKPDLSDAGWWYVVPLNWAFASGKLDRTDSPTGLLKLIEGAMEGDGIEKGRRVNPRAPSQQLAIKAALGGVDVDLAKPLPSKKETKQIAAQLLAYAAKWNGCTAVTNEEILFKALVSAGIKPPSTDQLARLTTEM